MDIELTVIKADIMDKQQNDAKFETDLTDSWTLVSDDDPDERKTTSDAGEHSDSESLEVLEVELASPEEISSHEEDRDEGNRCEEEFTVKDSEDSGAPVISIPTVKKRKTYSHQPSAYINMWLSIIMVITVAITLGLGMGHYLGSKRFARAKDMIHHLQYENQMLEQELVNAVSKHKYCEKEMTRNRDAFYENFHNVNDENVCYAHENPFMQTPDEMNNFSKSVPTSLQWFALINGKHNRVYAAQDVILPNRKLNSQSVAKGDTSFDVNVFLKRFPKRSDCHISDVSSQLICLRSLLKKWGDLLENLKFQTKVNVKIHERQQATLGLREVDLKDLPVSDTSDKSSLNESKNITAISCDDCSRSKVNQRSLCGKEEEHMSNCRVLLNFNLFTSPVSNYNNESTNIFQEKNTRNEFGKIESRKFDFADRWNKKRGTQFGDKVVPNLQNRSLHLKREKLWQKEMKRRDYLKTRTEKKTGNLNHSENKMDTKISKNLKYKAKLKNRNKLEKFSQVFKKKDKMFYKDNHSKKDKRRKENHNGHKNIKQYGRYKPKKFEKQNKKLPVSVKNVNEYYKKTYDMNDSLKKKYKNINNIWKKGQFKKPKNSYIRYNLRLKNELNEKSNPTKPRKNVTGPRNSEMKYENTEDEHEKYTRFHFLKRQNKINQLKMESFKS